MSEVVINVTKVEEVVTINATPNVTQILVNTNSGGGIQSVVAGTNITIDDTDPLNPIISASGGGGAVDSVNGQTGVVVLDATDVGAEPTKGANDNYVTDAQLVIIGNTSGTNTGDNATNTTSNSYADAKVASELASFKTANFIDFTSSGQTQLDAKANKSTTQIILKNNYTPNTITAPITTETIVDNYDLGVGFLAVGESLNLYAELVKNVTVNGTANTFIYLSKVSNSIAVGDAVRIATSSGLGSGGGSNYIERTFHRRTSSILSGRIAGTTAGLTDKVSINNIPQNIINDATLSDFRFLIVTSTYSGTSAPNTMQTNVILTKNPVV